jgi:hypothetical protein
MARSTFPPGHARAVDEHPRICVGTLTRKVARLRELEAGAELRRHESVAELRRVIRRWIDACREVGVCKRCGERLNGDSPDALLARERGVGGVCWVEKLDDAERADITGWVEQQRLSVDRLEEPR